MNKALLALGGILLFLSGAFSGWLITSNQLAKQGIITPITAPPQLLNHFWLLLLML